MLGQRTSSPTGDSSGSGKPQRVLIADRDPLFLLGLRSVLDSRFEVVGDALTGRHVLESAASIQPEILIAGFVLGCGRDTLGLAVDIQAVSPATAMVVLLPDCCSDLAEPLLRSGARAIVPRSALPATLLSAIERVIDGEVFVASQLSPNLPSQDSTAGHVDLTVLTAREIEVFRLFGLGKSYTDIAYLLDLSPKTIEKHRENIKVKVRVKSAAAMLLLARAQAFWESTAMDHLI